MDYISVQGQTIDEVYVNVDVSEFLDRNNEVTLKTYEAYNKALYTSTSRASKYLYLGSVPVLQQFNPGIAEQASVGNNTASKVAEFSVERSKDQEVLALLFGEEISIVEEEEEAESIDVELDNTIAPSHKKEEEEEDTILETPLDNGDELENGIVPVDDTHDPATQEVVEDTEEEPTNNFRHSLQNTYNKGLKKGRNVSEEADYRAVLKGDKVYYVINEYEDGTGASVPRVLIVAELEAADGTFYYREIGVVGDNDIELLKTGTTTANLTSKFETTLSGTVDNAVYFETETFGRSMLYLRLMLRGKT